MFPPPRPPSPTSRDRVQKARLGDTNPNSLSPKDAEILMSLQKPATQPSALPEKSSRRESKATSLKAESGRNMRGSVSSEGGFLAGPSSPDTPAAPDYFRRQSGTSAGPNNPDASLLAWVNSCLPPHITRAKDFSASFQSGQILCRLAESLSGQRRAELAGEERFEVNGTDDSFAHVDSVLDVFDFLLDLKVDTADVSVAEVLKGDSPQIIKLVHSIKDRFPPNTTL